MPKIIEIDNNLSMDEKRENLRNLYDAINDIAKSLWEKGEDVSKYFYTKEEYEEIKKTSKNLI